MSSTIHDVATLAGLSLGTVSKYINGVPVKEANRVRIENAIKQLNYRPNNIAKGLRTSKSFAVAVLCPMLSSIYCATIIASIEKYLLPRGYCVIVSECHDDVDMELKKTAFLLDRMVDGIILLPFSTDGKQIDMIQQDKIPLVLIDQLIPTHPTDCVVLDNELSTFKPVETLIKMGHTEIAILTGDPHLYTAMGRINGYKNAMNKYHLPIHDYYIKNGHYTMSGGYEAIMDLYQGSHLPSAILISNYDMTIGGFLAINYLKLKVPDDVSIIGYDNLPISQVVTPPLSLIEQPMDKMGYHAAKLLYARMKGDYTDYPKVLVHNATFTVKESVKNLNGNVVR